MFSVSQQMLIIAFIHCIEFNYDGPWNLFFPRDYIAAERVIRVLLLKVNISEDKRKRKVHERRAEWTGKLTVSKLRFREAITEERLRKLTPRECPGLDRAHGHEQRETDSGPMHHSFLLTRSPICAA